MNKIVKELVASVRKTKPTKAEVEEGRQRVRASLIRAGYTKKEATKMTNRKNYF